MKISLLHTFRKYNIKNLPKDILAGIIIAAVSIPISMGYAQIAGLPAVYGLYGSVFPIIIFALFTTSPQFVFGVDAAPAALTGSALMTMGIASGTKDALRVVPVITIFTGIWLIIFFIMGAGKLVNYISTPVMGGFISGICCTIILMQVPKLFGASAGTGELVELLEHLINSLKSVDKYSMILGLSTLVILLVSKKLVPKFPMAVVMMAAGAILSYNVNLEKYNITMLSKVNPGMPKFILPDIAGVDFNEVAGVSLTIAIVIMAETLLSENNFAMKNGYKVDNNQELLAFGLGNIAGSLTGCCPINGSVSRTSMSDQYGGKTQVSGLVAGLSMIFVLMFGTGFIGYLPVPVLTAIVISALMGACEFHLAAKLIKTSKNEFYIFMGAFLGVLLLGTIYGVLIGILLSFSSVIIRSADPPRYFLGIMPGHDEFFNMSQFKHTYPIKNVVIYRFNSNLFFANINTFQEDIENSIKEDTRAVIVDAGGISNIDATAAEHLKMIYESLHKQNIKFYMTEHISALNDQFRKMGLRKMVESGEVRRTIPLALEDLGITAPYPLEGVHNSYHSVKRKRAESSVREFVWAFGMDAENAIEKLINQQIENLNLSDNENIDETIDELVQSNWGNLNSMDEDEWIEHLEAHLVEIARISGEDEATLAERLEERREQIYKKIGTEHPELAKKFIERRNVLDERMKEKRPEIYEKIIKFRSQHSKN